MDKIQDEAKKQIKDIEGKYMEAFEDRMSEVRNHYEEEREAIIAKFNEAKEVIAKEVCYGVLDSIDEYDRNPHTRLLPAHSWIPPDLLHSLVHFQHRLEVVLKLC